VTVTAGHSQEFATAPALAQSIVRIAGGFCLLFGVLVLLGWVLAPEALQSITRERASMKVNVAVGLSLFGAILSLFGTDRPQRHDGVPIRILIGLSVVLPFGTALEYALAGC
jgi:hypothetical protein